MFEQNRVHGMKITDESWPGCSACDHATATRTPQPTHSATDVINLLHEDTIVGDIVGKIDPAGLQGEHFLSVFMDIKTRFMSCLPQFYVDT